MEPCKSVVGEMAGTEENLHEVNGRKKKSFASYQNDFDSAHDVHCSRESCSRVEEHSNRTTEFGTERSNYSHLKIKNGEVGMNSFFFY